MLEGFTRVSALNVPLTISGVQIMPDDYIVGDVDGVCVIPKDLLPQVKEMCAKRLKQEAQCLKELKKGKGLTETFSFYRK
jgi:4-hydroxy-4-methyl-2-oxoglutarate aldolase